MVKRDYNHSNSLNRHVLKLFKMIIGNDGYLLGHVDINLRHFNLTASFDCTSDFSECGRSRKIPIPIPNS